MSTTTAPPFSAAEYSVLGHLLALVAEQFSYKSDTQFSVAASAEHKAIVAAAIERIGLSGSWGDDETGWETYVAAVMEADEQIVTFMDWMADFLSARCHRLAAGAGAGAPMTAAEQALVAELLAVARDDHDEAEALNLIPYAIDVTADNRAVLATIFDEQSRQPGQENSVPLKAALRYFEERCHRYV